MQQCLQSDERANLACSITQKGMFLNLFLSALKFVAGILGASAAMVADAVHSLSDLLSDFVVLVGFKLAKKPADETHPYGHGKIETFVAFLIGAILLLVGFGILTNAIFLIRDVWSGSSLMRPNKIALFMALISVVLKEILFQRTLNLATKLNSRVLLANAWHHRSDALSSVAAFLGISGAFLLGEKWLFLDPLAAFVVAFFILKLSAEVMLESLNDLLEASLSPDVNDAIRANIISVTGVKEVHGLRTRCLGPGKAVEIHICVDPGLNIIEAHDIATAVENSLKEEFGKEMHVAIHVEPYGYKQKLN